MHDAHDSCSKELYVLSFGDVALYFGKPSVLTSINGCSTYAIYEK